MRVKLTFEMNAEDLELATEDGKEMASDWMMTTGEEMVFISAEEVKPKEN